MEFSYNPKREWNSYAQRSVVMAPRGMVASSQHLASLVGYRVLAKGGNAIDAAVAMVSTLSVVEPFCVGIGGDAFAMIYMRGEEKIIGMNASGRAPHNMNIDWFHDQGIRTIPERGILSVTVPGALHGWAQLIGRYGKLNIEDVFEDAIYYGENGFPVTEVIAGEWKSLKNFIYYSKGLSETYTINGKIPQPCQVFRNKDLAGTYRKIIQEGVQTFYEGEICKAIVDFSDKENGLLSLRDFLEHTTTWVDPLSSNYRGYTIYQLPPNGQGLTALQMLNILKGYDIGGLKHNSPEYLHILIEAKKIAFLDRDSSLADPEFECVPVNELLSEEYARQCRCQIVDNRAMVSANFRLNSPVSETVYVSAVDQDRNAISLISSIYEHFGSGMVVDGTGIILQNRGKSFSLNPTHPNRVLPHKRPMHTIIPGMMFKDGKFLMSFGVMGGDMQPQGHVQLLANLIDFKMNLQEAVDAPRIRHLQGLDIYVEDGISNKAQSLLQEKGHHIIKKNEELNHVGGAQAIYLDRSENVLLGASDRRKDGCAIGY